MRYYPCENVDIDKEELEYLSPPDWMLEMLKLNPSYCSWGIHEDYMPGKGWRRPMEYETWDEFNLQLDELNECVNFYFEINKEEEDCSFCKDNGPGRGLGTHPDAQWVTESCYGHCNPFRRGKYPSEELLEKYGEGFRQFCREMNNTSGGWLDEPLKEDEIAALEERERSIEQHDAINRWIIETIKLDNFGIPSHCPECDGRGYIPIESDPHLSLVLWILHPRKGASRGCKVYRVAKDQVPEALEFLRTANDRNIDRFKEVEAFSFDGGK